MCEEVYVHVFHTWAPTFCIISCCLGGAGAKVSATHAARRRQLRLSEALTKIKDSCESLSPGLLWGPTPSAVVWV